jgi:hypothetical protein
MSYESVNYLHPDPVYPDDPQRQEGARGLWHRRGWPTNFTAA